MESPNTATVRVPGSCADGWWTSTGTSAPTSGPTSAAESIAGPGVISGCTPAGNTVIVTTAAVAAVAPARGSIGTNTGRQRWIGCSSSHHDPAASATVTMQRTANSGQPANPVCAPFSTRKTGQCQRYTP